MSIRVTQTELDEEFLFEEFTSASTLDESLIRLKLAFEKLLRRKLGFANIPFIRLIFLYNEKVNLTPEQLKVMLLLHEIESVMKEVTEPVFYYILFNSKPVLLRLLNNPGILPPQFDKVSAFSEPVELPVPPKRENYNKLYIVSFHAPDSEKNYARLFCKQPDGSNITVILFKPWDVFIDKNILTHGQVVGFYNLKHGEKEWLFICDKMTLMVVSPDIILDVTDIKSAIRNVNDYILSRLIYSKSTNRNQVIGNIVNKFLDELLLMNITPDDDYIKNLIMDFKFSLSLAGVKTSDVFDDVKTHIISIMESGLVERIRSNGLFSVEPTYISTEFGISGRIDVFCHDENEIIELKTGKPKDFGAWVNDETQTALYSLMVQHKKENPNEKVIVFYSKDEKKQFRFLNLQYPYAYLDSMIRRNEMIAFDRKLAALNQESFLKIIGSLSEYEGGALQLPLVNKLKKLNEDLNSNSVKSIVCAYVSEFISFCERERYCQKTEFASLWTKSIQQKREEFKILGPLKYQSSNEEMSIVIFSIESNESKFREGDICLIYDAALEISKQQIFKGSIKSIDKKSITIALKNRGSLKFIKEEKEWFLESDYMDVGMRKNIWALMDFAASDERKQKLLLGLDPPLFDERDTFFTSDKLTNSQKEAITNAVRAKDYYLIQGPPGTGKTTLLAHLISELIKDNNEILLVTAFTNRAVDEIISKFISETGMTDMIIRLGNELSTDYPEYSISNLIKGVPEDEVLLFLKSKRIYFSTIATASYNEIMQSVEFTTTIIDESSQIIEPEALSVIMGTKRFILIGDEKQLPAVVSQVSGYENVEKIYSDSNLLKEIGIKKLDSSLFERLIIRAIANKWNSFTLLDTQFRMNEELLEFSNKNFYGSKLKTGISNNTKETEFSSASLTLNSNPIEFFDIRTPGEKKKNKHEADTLIKLLLKYYEENQEKSLGMSFGVIAPFRAQVSYIHQELAARGIEDVKVDTVERFQGGERDIIFISFTVYHHAQVSQIQSLQDYGALVVDRKLNVALTRAKKKLVMLGNANLLSRSPIFKKLIESCKEKGRFYSQNF